MSPVSSPSPPTAPAVRPQAPALRVVPRAAAGYDRDRFTGSPARRLAAINEEAGGLLVRSLRAMASQPLRTLASCGAALLEPFLHPLAGLARCKAVFERDGWVDGGLNALLYLSTAVTTASFVVMGAACLLAPLTGGASLAVAAAASQMMVVSGLHDAAVTVAMLAKDEHDALAAKDDQALDHAEERLADDFLNTFFAWATLPLSDAATALTVAPQGMWQAARAGVKPARAGVVARRAAARAVGTSARGQEG